MANTATLNINASVRILEAAANDLGRASMLHELVYPGTLRSEEHANGTGDYQQDLVWSDTRTLVATTEQLDCRGVLVGGLPASPMNLIEVRGIFIRNRNTTAAHVLKLGAGANPVTGLFGDAASDKINIGAGGCFLWHAPLDGGGIATTAGTADMLTLDSGANTVTYDIIIWGVSA